MWFWDAALVPLAPGALRILGLGSRKEKERIADYLPEAKIIGGEVEVPDMA